MFGCAEMCANHTRVYITVFLMIGMDGALNCRKKEVAHLANSRVSRTVSDGKSAQA